MIYINYDRFKSMLDNYKREAPDPEHTDAGEVQRFATVFSENWFTLAEEELKKMNYFYEERVAEASRKFQQLQVTGLRQPKMCGFDF